MNLGEQQLSEALRRGDRAAQRELFIRLGGHLMAVAQRYLGSQTDETRDVLQDAVLKILTKAERFRYDGEGSLKAWCTRVVANECVDHLRHRNLLLPADDRMPDELIDDDVDDSPMKVPPEVLTALIGKLPPGYRTVLNLYVFEQLPHKEIAHRLGINERSSSSQYLRAKRMLKKLITDYIKNEEG